MKFHSTNTIGLDTRPKLDISPKSFGKTPKKLAALPLKALEPKGFTSLVTITLRATCEVFSSKMLLILFMVNQVNSNKVNGQTITIPLVIYNNLAFIYIQLILITVLIISLITFSNYLLCFSLIYIYIHSRKQITQQSTNCCCFNLNLL